MLLRALPNEVCKLFLACGHLHNIARNGLSPRSPLKSEEVMSQGRMKQVLSQKTRGHQGKQFKTVLRHDVVELMRPGRCGALAPGKQGGLASPMVVASPRGYRGRRESACNVPRASSQQRSTPPSQAPCPVTTCRHSAGLREPASFPSPPRHLEGFVHHKTRSVEQNSPQTV